MSLQAQKLAKKDHKSEMKSILCFGILEVMLVNEVAGFVQPREDWISSLMIVKLVFLSVFAVRECLF
jgi:hypothetical protein